MDEIQNAQQKRLYESLSAITDERTAGEIVLAETLPKSPTDKRKADWAERVCGEMEKRLSKEDVINARMACHCRVPIAKFEKLRRAYAISGDLSEYVRAQNEANTGASFWLKDGAVFMSYPRCYCSFIKNAGRAMPESWCYCSLGYAKALHDYVLHADTRAELIESVAAGGEKCVIRITLSKEESKRGFEKCSNLL